MNLVFPSNPNTGDTVYQNGSYWTWDGLRWNKLAKPGYTGSLGYSGSIGYSGSYGYTGSIGIGYAGSIGPSGGYSGSQGYTGSQGIPGSPGGYTGSSGYNGSLGYTGSIGIGYTGSQGNKSYVYVSPTYDSTPVNGELWFDTNSGLLSLYYGDDFTWVEIGNGARGPAGYTGSVGGGSGGGNGYTGSVGYAGSLGYSGSLGPIGYTGSSASGGSGLTSRQSINFNSGIAIPAGTSVLVNLTLFKSYMLQSITVSNPAWITIYDQNASAVNDASRNIGTMPFYNSGVMAEVVTSTTNQTIIFSPGVLGFVNPDGATSATIKIYNTGTSAVQISGSIKLVQLEI